MSAPTCTAPWHTPLVNTEGRISEPWALYFACLERNANTTGGVIDPGGRPRSSGTGCTVTTIFQGQEVCLSPFPLLDNPIAGQYLTDLYNFLQSVPGAWQFGCIQGTGPDGNPLFIWPWVDEDPRPTLPIPGDWAPYMIVQGTVLPYVGSFVIHRDVVCP